VVPAQRRGLRGAKTYLFSKGDLAVEEADEKPDDKPAPSIVTVRRGLKDRRG
jgi:hypothetical protein